MALLITTDGSVRKLSSHEFEGSRDNDGAFSLRDLQQLVGGYIEAVALSPVIEHENARYQWMVINEEGKFQSLKRNEKATIMATDVLRPGDFIAGNALILEDSEFQ